MSNDLSSLSEDHVRQLGRIIETLEKSTFDYLQIEVGELKVTVGKGNIAIPASAPAPTQAASAAVVAPAPAAPAPAPQAAVPAPAPAATIASQAGTVEIKAPLMGMFYAQPEPGAAPFVTVGASITEDTTVGLVEVMKTFNAVSAGVRGKIVEVCVPDAQVVEYGQVLFRVLPE